LLGSAALTLLFGLTGHRVTLRVLLIAAGGIMVVTGVGFASTTVFWALLVIGVVGTLNPSSGDVSVFLPTEQALVAAQVAAPRRPWTFAVYNVGAVFAGALGALASGLPARLARNQGWDVTRTQQWSFLLYAAAGVVILVLYTRLADHRDTVPEILHERPTRALATSRRTVLELAALFSLDSAGGGFVVTSLLVLWLHLRFDLSAGTTAAVFFAAGVLAGCSQLLAPRLAARLGLVRTMVFTHMPASVFLVLAAFAPNGTVAIALLLCRALLSQIDVPARQSFVMAVVPAGERAAAASVTNVPRSLASALTPLLAGMLLARTTFGWPLVIAGVMKITYDLLLLALYRDVREEEGARRR
jgi:MFS family permease